MFSAVLAASWRNVRSALFCKAFKPQGPDRTQDAVQWFQGPSGCAKMLWRKSLDGYLRQILNARVYDVAVMLAAGSNPTIFTVTLQAACCHA